MLIYNLNLNRQVLFKLEIAVKSYLLLFQMQVSVVVSNVDIYCCFKCRYLLLCQMHRLLFQRDLLLFPMDLLMFQMQAFWLTIHTYLARSWLCPIQHPHIFQIYVPAFKGGRNVQEVVDSNVCVPDPSLDERFPIVHHFHECLNYFHLLSAKYWNFDQSVRTLFSKWPKASIVFQKPLVKGTKPRNYFSRPRRELRSFTFSFMSWAGFIQ